MAEPKNDDSGDKAPPGDAEPSDVDGLKRALGAERDKRKAAEEALARARRNDEAGDERLSAMQQRVLRAEVLRAATGKLADPKDALSLLDLTAFQPNDDGEYDAAAIDSALEELVKNKSYLAPKAPVPRAPQGTRHGGPAGVSGDEWLRSLRSR